VLVAVLDTGNRITHEELAAQVIDPADLDFGDVPGWLPTYVDSPTATTRWMTDGHGTSSRPGGG
jgi:hypothetical protein